MAKQTFTTGSVLTAAQMNSLQANDYNWTVSQKTASYVLVAADAGTRIEMNAAGATTITVNTGLFAAGDTLFIQNIGAGATTITAGTATVNKATAGSLTLSQYQGGTLYFVSASSAVFFADAGYTPPLTTKGDLFGYDTAAARIPIGSNDQVLTADSTQALGLKWAAVNAASQTVITSGSFSGTTNLSLSSITQTYKDLRIIITGAYTASSANYMNLTVNGLSSGIWNSAFTNSNVSTVTNNENIGNISLVEDTTTGTNSANTSIFDIFNYTEGSNAKVGRITAITYSNSNAKWIMRATGFGVRVTAAITSINIQSASGMQGSYQLIGIK